MSVDASKITPPARVLVGSDDKSHIVGVFGVPWCEEEFDEFYDEAPDVDCPGCIAAFEEGSE